LSGCQQLPVKHGLFLLVQGFMLVVRAPDGSPIGVAYASSLLSFEHGGASGWIKELYVTPQWRGRGIGSRLIAEVIARAKESGWRALDLEVEASHQRAISLYARHQFSTSFSEQTLPNSLKRASRIKLQVDRRICGLARNFSALHSGKRSETQLALGLQPQLRRRSKQRLRGKRFEHLLSSERARPALLQWVIDRPADPNKFSHLRAPKWRDGGC
jgi:N-acetylglutamate synthase-like GNAT family acetyltransferase